MNNRGFLPGVFLMLVLAVSISAERIVIVESETQKRDIFAVSRDIEVQGRIDGSVFLIGGQFVVEGYIAEDVVCIATRVSIRKGAVIGGNLVVFGGSLDRSRESEIRGDYFNTPFNLKEVESTILPDLVGRRDLSGFRILKILLWIILGLLILALFHRNVLSGEEILRRNFGRSMLSGAISAFVFVFLFLLFILLSFFVIGIPFAIALVLLTIGFILFGRTVVFLLIGGLIGRKWAGMKNRPVVFLLIGGVVYGLFKLIPVVGRLGILFTIPEMGVATLYFLRHRLKKKLDYSGG